jgi:hypothetical protein
MLRGVKSGIRMGRAQTGPRARLTEYVRGVMAQPDKIDPNLLNRYASKGKTQELSVSSVSRPGGGFFAMCGYTAVGSDDRVTGPGDKLF